ncbi:MAG TPA: di-trans,poly-cis-decaprenylcistransferase [Chlamydiae bacterium]|nr:di-trans,poly-cis-decaprenylcistransferase [Chlamydiota bacterium]
MLKNKKIFFLTFIFFIFPLLLVNVAAFDDFNYQKNEFVSIEAENIPKHVAIIMDGNRRWAKENDLSLYEGYIKGAEALSNIIEASVDLGVKILTVYVFSTENWSREKEEIDTLKDLFEYMCINQKNTLIDLGVRLDTIGDISKFPKSTQDSFNELKKTCQNGKKLDLILAINYGGRDEINRAMLKIIDDVENNIIKKEEITQNLIASYLDTNKIPDPDLLIRTAGEARLSNFLLWQVAYTEIYISDFYWPAFSKLEFMKAILDFQKRSKKVGS